MISSIQGPLLKTDAIGNVIPAVAGVDYATGGSIAGEKDWQVRFGALTPTTTLGILVNASSTIGNGTRGGGLTISGGATTTGIAYFRDFVGIGTSIPEDVFDLRIPSTQTAYLGTSNVSSNVQLTNGAFSSNSGLFRISGNTRSGVNVPITFEPSGSEAVRITTAGLLGINTTDPKSFLDVAGNASFGTYAGVTAASTNGIIVSGSVGIGTTST